MKNLILCLMMVFVVACGSEQVCDCPEIESETKFDFFSEHYSVCLATCQLAVSLVESCGVEGFTVESCTEQYWDGGLTNNNCVVALSCFQAIRDTNNCDWTSNIEDNLPTFKSGCPYD
jgi:hypothetical protein